MGPQEMSEITRATWNHKSCLESQEIPESQEMYGIIGLSRIT